MFLVAVADTQNDVPRAAQRSGLLLLESLSTRQPSDHARIHSHYMAAHPIDAEPPTTLHFASTKPKPATFAKEGWHKEAAKRKLFLFYPRQSGEETLPIYSLFSRSAWEWDGNGPGRTVPSAYAACGLLALPVTFTPLFVAHEDPLLELPSDCPTAVNSDPSQLAGLQHLFIRSFIAEYEVEDSHKEALAIAEERWARIFNHKRPVAGRAQDPPDGKMVWGKPEDMSKHPDGEEHIRVWDLPRPSAMVTRVKAKLEAILGKTLHVMTQGYVMANTRKPWRMLFATNLAEGEHSRRLLTTSQWKTILQAGFSTPTLCLCFVIVVLFVNNCSMK